jgi:CAAX prenyl protease-like protein
MREKDEQPGAAVEFNPGGTLFNRAAVARIAPFLAYIFFIFATDMLERMGLSAQGLRWLYAARIGAVMLLLAAFWREYSELRLPRVDLAQVAISILTGVVVLILWISLSAPWMLIGESAGFDPRTDGRIDWLLVVVRIFGAAAVVPIMEELFWRSFLMRWIVSPDFQNVDPAQTTWKAALITIVLFAFEHNQWLAGIVAGVAYSALYVRYRTIWMPILAHAVTNFLLGIWVVRTGNWSYW